MNNHRDDGVTVNGAYFTPFIKETELHRKVVELAERINRDYEGKNPIFVCILNGAFVFFADFVRRIEVPCEVDFLKLSSYGEERISSGVVQLVKDLSCTVEGRHIVVVEDIVDSGGSVNFIVDWISRKNPASIKVVTLLYKPESSTLQCALDYVGFEIPSRFVVGYGLDYAQQGRNLPSVYMMRE